MLFRIGTKNSNFKQKFVDFYFCYTLNHLSRIYIYIYVSNPFYQPCMRAFIAHLWAHLSSVYKRDLLESLVPLMKMMESFLFSFPFLPSTYVTLVKTDI